MSNPTMATQGGGGGTNAQSNTNTMASTGTPASAATGMNTNVAATTAPPTGNNTGMTNITPYPAPLLPANAGKPATSGTNAPAATTTSSIVPYILPGFIILALVVTAVVLFASRPKHVVTTMYHPVVGASGAVTGYHPTVSVTSLHAKRR